MRFYVTRDRNAARWGVSDLPADPGGNVDHFDAPFNRTAHQAPVLSDREISDLVAFLGTLTDRDVR